MSAGTTSRSPVTACAGHLFVAPTGEIDLATAPRLRDEIVQAATGDSSLVVIDLTGVTFLDSVGIGVIVGGHRRLRTSGQRMHLANPGPMVRKVLEVTRVVAVIPTFGSVAEAVEGCPRAHVA